LKAQGEDRAAETEVASCRDPRPSENIAAARHNHHYYGSTPRFVVQHQRSPATTTRTAQPL